MEWGWRIIRDDSTTRLKEHSSPTLTAAQARCGDRAKKLHGTLFAFCMFYDRPAEVAASSRTLAARPNTHFFCRRQNSTECQEGLLCHIVGVVAVLTVKIAISALLLIILITVIPGICF